MYIYHSIPAPVRVTVVGRYNSEEGQLELAVARCSKRDMFQKRTISYPAKPAYEVQTKNGPKIIPARPSKIVRGGIDIAKKRLNSEQIFAAFDMEDCSNEVFNEYAQDIASMVMENPKLIEEVTNGKQCTD